MIILRDYIEVSSSDAKKHIIAEMHVVRTGDFYAIDSSGTWEKQG